MVIRNPTKICCLFLLTTLLASGEADDHPLTANPGDQDEANMAHLWLSVRERSRPGERPTHVKFNRKAVNDFQQCMCRSDFAHCQVLANGTVVDKNQWPEPRRNISFMCKVSNKMISCDGLPPPGNGFRPPALHVFGNQCPLRNVSVYWDENQEANVSVRAGDAGSIIRCADKCKTMEEMERGDKVDMNVTAIALIVVCICLLIVAIALAAFCVIRRKRLRRQREFGSKTKVGVVNDGIEASEKKSAPPIESVCSYNEKEKNPDSARFGAAGPYGEKGMSNEGILNRSYGGPTGFPLLVWPMDASVRPPEYELNPPPYFALFQPKSDTRDGGGQQSSRSNTSSQRGGTDDQALSLHLQTPRSRASIHTDV